MPGHGVDLHAEGRDPEVVQDVLADDVELHRLALGHVELRGRERSCRRCRVYSKVQVNCWPMTLTWSSCRVGRRLLDVVQDDVGVGAQRDQQRRRHRRPDDLEPRVAVDRRAVELLLARAHPELDDRDEDDRRHEDEDRDRDDEQDVPERVDLVGLRGACGGNQLIASPSDDPDDRCDDAEDDRAITVGRSEASLPRSMSARILCPARDERHIASAAVPSGLTQAAARGGGRLA